MRAIKKIGDFLDKISKICSMLLTGLIFCVIVIQVIMRYCLGTPLTWSEELARLAMIWLTYIGASSALRNHTLVAVDIFVKKAPDFTQKGILIACDIIMLAITGLLFYYSVLILGTPGVILQKTSALRLPMRIVYSCLPIGYGMMIYHILADILNQLFEKRDEEVNE